MPKPPVPEIVDAFLRQPNPAVVATLMPSGAPHTAATWYVWEDGRFLVNMAASRRRLDYMRRDGRVALTALGEQGWYRQVSLFGRVAELRPDPDLADIDRLARHYVGQPHGTRDQERWSAWVDVDRWHGWEGGRPWPQPGA